MPINQKDNKIREIDNQRKLNEESELYYPKSNESDTPTFYKNVLRRGWLFLTEDIIKNSQIKGDEIIQTGTGAAISVDEPAYRPEGSDDYRPQMIAAKSSGIAYGGGIEDEIYPFIESAAADGTIEYTIDTRIDSHIRFGKAKSNASVEAGNNSYVDVNPSDFLGVNVDATTTHRVILPRFSLSGDDYKPDVATNDIVAYIVCPKIKWIDGATNRQAFMAVGGYLNSSDAFQLKWAKAYADWTTVAGNASYVTCHPCTNSAGTGEDTGTNITIYLPRNGSGQDPNVRDDDVICYQQDNNGVLIAQGDYLDHKIGDIIMTTDTSDARIGRGWQLANGSNSTENLCGRVVAGYDSTDDEYNSIDASESQTTPFATSNTHSHMLGTGCPILTDDEPNGDFDIITNSKDHRDPAWVLVMLQRTD